MANQISKRLEVEKSHRNSFREQAAEVEIKKEPSGNELEEIEGDQGQESFAVAACRVCCAPRSSSIRFLSLFEDNRAEIVSKVTGIDVSFLLLDLSASTFIYLFLSQQFCADCGKREALICADCFDGIKRAQKMRLKWRKKILKAEEKHFKIQRESSANEQDGNDSSGEDSNEINEDIAEYQENEVFETLNHEEQFDELRKQIKISKRIKKSRRKKFDEILKCKTCGKVFKGSQKIGHRRQHQLAVHEKFRPFKCDLCNFSATLKGDLKTHLKRHANNPNFKPQNSYDSSRPFKCSIEGCSKYFKRKYHLKCHERDSHRGKFYQQL
jgi:hypothetical protein